MAAVKKSVSVKDVARLAGVSEQTVSRTVHDSPSVRPETKERVRAAMRELGYRPNFAGRSLRRGKFKTVGVAMFNITGTGNLDRMEGFAAAADKHGYAITLIQSRRASVYPRECIVAHERAAGGWHGCDHESHAGGLRHLRAAARHANGARYHAGAPALFNGR